MALRFYPPVVIQTFRPAGAKRKSHHPTWVMAQK